MNNARRAILEIQLKDVRFADVRVPDRKITTATERLANVNAKRIMTDINATSVRFVA